MNRPTEEQKRFRKKINTDHKLAPGHARAFYACAVCGELSWRDYVPFSLANPILSFPCGHVLNLQKLF